MREDNEPVKQKERDHSTLLLKRTSAGIIQWIGMTRIATIIPPTMGKIEVGDGSWKGKMQVGTLISSIPRPPFTGILIKYIECAAPVGTEGKSGNFVLATGNNLWGKDRLPSYWPL
ncbi:hypothetical protein Dimus_007438 [Dionaea muscipula]